MDISVQYNTHIAFCCGDPTVHFQLCLFSNTTTRCTVDFHETVSAVLPNTAKCFLVSLEFCVLFVYNEVNKLLSPTAWMQKTQYTYIILVGKVFRKWLLGRLRRRRQDNMKLISQRQTVTDGTASDYVLWWVLILALLNLWFLLSGRNS
jgi:hypothetical protein